MVHVATDPRAVRGPGLIRSFQPASVVPGLFGLVWSGLVWSVLGYACPVLNLR